MKIVKRGEDRFDALLTDEEILPCPFCGSTEVELCHTWTASYWMECRGCGAEVSDPDGSGDPSKRSAHKESAERAVAAWNRRA